MVMPVIYYKCNRDKRGMIDNRVRLGIRKRRNTHIRIFTAKVYIGREEFMGRIRKLFDTNLSMDEKIFNYTLTGGTIASTFGFVSTFMSEQPLEATVLSAVWTIFTALSFLYFHKTKKFDVGFIFMCLILNVMGFPSMFIYGGGITGGMPLFFAFGLVFTFLLIKKPRRLIPILTIESLVYVGLIMLSYFYPEFIHEFPDRETSHMDIGINIFIVAFSIGTVMKVVFNQMVKERERVDVLNGRLHDMSNKDYMTGLYNRKILFESIAEIEQKKEYRVAMVMMDIDKFKRINDHYGHLAGDKVINGVADIIKKNFVHGVNCRYGGEEFLTIIEDTSIEEAVQMCENVRKEVEISSFGEVSGVTLSCGVGYCSSGENIENLIKEVDERLYAAKGSGRNRVVFTSD